MISEEQTKHLLTAPIDEVEKQSRRALDEALALSAKAKQAPPE